MIPKPAVCDDHSGVATVDDRQWAELCGGYRIPYDPRGAIGRLNSDDTKAAWAELWQELYHQGDVGEASYAAVPMLVDIHEVRGVADWNTYAIAATIEEARQMSHNPIVPDWLLDDYNEAWKKLQTLASTDLPMATDSELVDTIIAVLAFGKGRISLGRMAMLADDERTELLDGSGFG